MSYYQVIVAVVNAYIEREKVKDDNERALKIIKEITDKVEASKQEIIDALNYRDIIELRGNYLGANLNVNEYENPDQHLYILQDTATFTNIIQGRLMSMYQEDLDLTLIRQIVELMTLVLNLRGLVLSQLKYRHNDNRDEQLLEQLQYLKDCWERVSSEQYRDHVAPAHRNWLDCEQNPSGGTTCTIIIGEEDEFPQPTSCCSEKFYYYDRVRSIFNQDIIQKDKVNEAITILRGSILINKW